MLQNGKPNVKENLPQGLESEASTRLDSAVPFERQAARALNLSVLMLGFDSLSRMAWIRLLPKTRDYFVKQLGGIELKGEFCPFSYY